MIKVLNVISDKNVGGAGRVLINYVKYRDREKYDVSVALPRGSLLKKRLEPFGVTIYELEGAPDKSLDFSGIKELKKLIKSQNFDIIHTHGSMTGRIAGRQCRKTVIYTRHSAFPVSGYLRRGPGHLLNKLVNEHYADRIISVSPATVENLTDGGISEEYIDVVMNGVEPVKKLSPPEIQAFRKKLNIEDGLFVFGILARFEEYKGHEIILRAADALKKQGRKFMILMAGAGSGEEQVRRGIIDRGLADCVQVIGFVNNVAELLSALDIQLNASFGTEATSLSLLEGMSMGLPAIVSDYGGNPYVIKDGENGLVFETGDSGQLAGLMAKVMDDAELRENLRQGAFRIFEESFTGEQFARNTEKIYEKALKGRK